MFTKEKNNKTVRKDTGHGGNAPRGQVFGVWEGQSLRNG